MRKSISFLLFSVLCCWLSAGCEETVGIGSGGGDSAVSVQSQELIDAAALDVSSQRFDAAMEKALRALELAQTDGSALMQVRALSCITGIDIMASRDADAWERATQAERMARENGFSNELAGILISKAKLCSYAEISPETGRNDEGLQYANEALSLAEQTDNYEQQSEACYVIASLYINKNRWNDPIDKALYDTAGHYLDRGQALADTYDIPRLRRNGIMFRSRWFQQGDRNDDAIRYFTQVLSGLKETDHLTASSLDDRLVRLYTRVGDFDNALAAHDDYVYRMQLYLNQRADEVMQEMETRFEVQNKERIIERRGYQISLLMLTLLLAAAVIIIVSRNLRDSRRRSAALQRTNNAKEQIIELLSHDLRNPAKAMAGEISKLSMEVAAMPVDDIRERCKELATNAESINSDVARYVGDILIDRSRRIADLGLSQREVEIIRLSAEGLSAAQIAERLFLSVHTVNTHRQRIYAKMDVRSVTDMIHKATQLGVI